MYRQEGAKVVRGSLEPGDLVTAVDGTPVGRAIESPDLASATVVLPAASLAHDGARVSFRYGPEGPDTAVGTPAFRRRSRVAHSLGR